MPTSPATAATSVVEIGRPLLPLETARTGRDRCTGVAGRVAEALPLPQWMLPALQPKDLVRAGTPYVPICIASSLALTDVRCAVMYAVGLQTRWGLRCQSFQRSRLLARLRSTTTETLSRPPRDRASSTSASAVALRSSVAAIKDAISSLGTSLKRPSVHTRRRSPSTAGWAALSISTSGPTPSARVRTPRRG
jgi:hypothetical protein